MRNDASHQDVATTWTAETSRTSLWFLFIQRRKSKNRLTVCAEAAGLFQLFQAVNKENSKWSQDNRRINTVTLVQTLPCDPINSFNGEWSDLVTRERRKRSVRLAAGRFKKKKKKLLTAATGIRWFRNLTSALPLLHSSVSTSDYFTD